jgi:hypothetical protein
MEGVPSGVLYLQCPFPTWGVAKHSCCFREHLTGEVRRISLLGPSVSRDRLRSDLRIGDQHPEHRI